MLRESIGLVDETGWRSQGQSAPEVAAGLTRARSGWEAGARLPGASERQLKEMGLQREPSDARFIAPLVARPWHIPGNDTFAALCAAGAAFGWREAPAEARRGNVSGMAPPAGGQSDAATP